MVLPPQEKLLHLRLCITSPMHELSANSRSEKETQSLDRVCIPPPQDWEHSSHVCQVLQIPSGSAQENSENTIISQ